MYARVMRLPFVLIVENNQFAYSTPLAKQHASARISDRAAGYGIPGKTIDGTDVEAVYGTCRDAVDRARRGDGPTLIESVTMRMHGHSASDDASYVPPALLERWKKKDPVDAYEQRLVGEGLMTRADIEALDARISGEIEKALSEAESSPPPDPAGAAEGVYAP